ncbi:hypothetical protein T484DRAFT_1981879 [Baffinella frigidus]|nr:hypothetical protein T484DRAFT_1981879 [Cryptophyta sp. CCMP2293]
MRRIDIDASSSSTAPTLDCREVEGCDESLSCIDDMRRIDASSSQAPTLDDPGAHTMNSRTLSSSPSPAPALVEDPGADNMHCRTVEDCDEFLSCIDDMRRIDASSPSPAPARIDNLETSLRCMRAMYADQGAQEAIANTANASNPAADTHTERREREARWRDLAGPRENIQRPAPGNFLRSSLQRASSGATDQCERPGPPTRAVSLEQEARPVLWFDAKAVAAAAASPHGSRAEVKLAMKRTMRRESL